MTIRMSCDHHGPNEGIPDNRSRKRMLEQLRAATTLSDALSHLFLHGIHYDHPGTGPVAIVELDAAVPLMQAWLAWLQVSPSGDDWHPPYDPPAEIRVPDIDDEPAPATDVAPDATFVASDPGSSVHDPKPPATDPS